MSRPRVAVVVGVVLLVAAVVVGCSAPSERRGVGVPLGSSGLRLLVADDPTPFVLEVDTGAIRPVTGLPADDRSTHVESVGQDAVVVSRRDCRGSDCDAGSVAYLVRHGSTVATRLGAAIDVQSSRDGRGVWLLSRQDATRCALGQVGLDGQPRRLALPMACEAVLIEELPAGLLVYGSAPQGGGEPYSALLTADGALRRLPQVVDGAAGGNLVLSTVEPGKLIALTDLRSGVSHRLPWPSGLEAHVMGLIGGHPDGRLAHVAFYPARSSRADPRRVAAGHHHPALAAAPRHAPAARPQQTPAALDRRRPPAAAGGARQRPHQPGCRLATRRAADRGPPGEAARTRARRLPLRDLVRRNIPRIFA
jgi:hypothetical protein